jgi:hypothetical protein
VRRESVKTWPRVDGDASCVGFSAVLSLLSQKCHALIYKKSKRQPLRPLVVLPELLRVYDSVPCDDGPMHNGTRKKNVTAKEMNNGLKQLRPPGIRSKTTSTLKLRPSDSTRVRVHVFNEYNVTNQERSSAKSLCAFLRIWLGKSGWICLCSKFFAA